VDYSKISSEDEVEGGVLPPGIDVAYAVCDRLRELGVSGMHTAGFLLVLFLLLIVCMRCWWHISGALPRDGRLQQCLEGEAAHVFQQSRCGLLFDCPHSVLRGRLVAGSIGGYALSRCTLCFMECPRHLTSSSCTCTTNCVHAKILSLLL
jgi:hypothetical protein